MHTKQTNKKLPRILQQWGDKNRKEKIDLGKRVSAKNTKGDQASVSQFQCEVHKWLVSNELSWDSASSLTSWEALRNTLILPNP